MNLIKQLITLSIALTLSACQSMPTNEPVPVPAPIVVDIPANTLLTLNRKIYLGQGHTHVVIQNSRVTTDRTKDLNSISCSLELKAFGPRTIFPGGFIVTRVVERIEQTANPILLYYYTDFYLDSLHNADVFKLACSAQGEKDKPNFTAIEVQTTLGQIFTLTFDKPK